MIAAVLCFKHVRSCFDKVNSEGYVKVTEYLRESVDALLNEAKDD